MVLDILKVSNQTPPFHTCWDLTRTKQGEKKEYTPFLAEPKYELSIRGLAQIVDEKSNFLRLIFYGPWTTPCQESTPTPSILLVFSL